MAAVEWRTRAARIVATCLLAVLPAACGRPDPTGGPASATEKPEVDASLARHWKRPLAHQSAAPLEPAGCGGCHPAQHADWRRSLHSRAMGPGVSGQLMPGANEAADPGQCTMCHAPLAEQALALAAANPQTPQQGLHADGLTCAGCHLREGRVYGPARRDGTAPGQDAAKGPHGGWTAAPAFEDARFCAACHQFDRDGYALNGKLLENTYEEWRASPHSARGQSCQSCQSCHMPERRHLWRGIHDPDMVRQALTIELPRPSIRNGEGVVADFVVRNTGAGHHFPTYVTPKVFLEAYQEGGAGRMLPGTLRAREISRDVTPDLSREIADTRIPAGGHVVFDYRAPYSPGASALVFRVRVDPDAFYRGVYEDLLARRAAGQGDALIRQALANANASGFVAYTARVPLAPIP